MAKKKLRPGDPWLYEWEQRVILDAARTMLTPETKLRPHPVLGSMFARLSDVEQRPGAPTFTVTDLVRHHPRRFKQQGLQAVLKRMAEDGTLRRYQGFGRYGKRFRYHEPLKPVPQAWRAGKRVA